MSKNQAISNVLEVKKMPNCEACEHSIFCPTWGEYKCTKKGIRFTTSLKNCDDYTELKGTKKVKPCRCEDCLGRNMEE